MIYVITGADGDENPFSKFYSDAEEGQSDFLEMLEDYDGLNDVPLIFGVFPNLAVEPSNGATNKLWVEWLNKTFAEYSVPIQREILNSDTIDD